MIKTQKNKIVTKLKNSNSDNTQIVTTPNNSKCDQTQILTKLKNSNCDNFSQIVTKLEL